MISADLNELLLTLIYIRDTLNEMAGHPGRIYVGDIYEFVMNRITEQHGFTEIQVWDLIDYLGLEDSVY